jgi:hypothetical protein
MIKRNWGFAGAVGFLCLAGIAVAADGVDNPVYKEQAARAVKSLPVNKARVNAALKAAALPAGQTAYYVVPAMSDVMRLPDTYPDDGRLNGELRIVAARDEFEPASFQLYSFTARKDVTLELSALQGPGGSAIPAKALDLKVVKVWFQNGNAWVSYFSDVGLKLVPELLLHDENMVKVDTRAVANFARLKDTAGERFVWISAPRKLEPLSFNPTMEPFEDAAVLQPVVLNAGEFKQFLLTAHVPKDQVEGVYRGAVSVKEAGKPLVEIPVSVRVLPFALPLPRPYFDLKRDFLVSVMGGTTLSGMKGLFGGDEKLAREKYRQYLVNQKNHGIFNPVVDQDEENFALLKELGLPTKPVMEGGGRRFMPWPGLNFGGRLTFDHYMSFKDGAQRCAAYYMKLVGHTDLLASYGDEQGTAFVATHRNAFKYYQDYGIKIGCAGHAALMNKGGYTYGIHPMGGEPDSIDRIRPWNEIGDKYVGFYASQHTGSENPQFVRRQHGLLGYLSNLSMVYNYEFALGPWNDLAWDLYKPMVLAYLNRGGLVDTLQWEGFREGIDDIRYATQLKLLVQEAMESGSTERMLEGKKALQYLALLNGAEMDVNVVRAEMINYILKLMQMRPAGEKR